MIDNKGRLWGKVSLIDIAIVLAVLVIGVGFAWRQAAPRLEVVMNPTDPFYITVESNRLRGVNVDAISVGDLMFRLHAHQPMGRVVDISVYPAMEVIRRSDGTAARVEMEGRYRVVLLLEAVGSINDDGYFVNGNDHIAPGSEIILVSNRVYLPVVLVYSLDQERPEI